MFVTRDEKHAQLQALETSTICYPNTPLPCHNPRLICGLCLKDAIFLELIYIQPLACSFFFGASCFSRYTCMPRRWGLDCTMVRCDSWNTLWFIKDILLALRGNKIPNQIAVALVCPLNPQRPDHISTEAGNHRTAVVDPAHNTISIAGTVLSAAPAHQRADGAPVMFYVTFVVASLSQRPLAVENQSPTLLHVTQSRIFI